VIGRMDRMRRNRKDAETPRRRENEILTSRLLCVWVSLRLCDRICL
jgi:hypothetical protein